MQVLDYGVTRGVRSQMTSGTPSPRTITIFGATEELPPTVGMINEDGEFTFSGDDFEGVMTDPECGESRITRMTLVFMDSTAVFEQVVETTNCGNSTVAATMARE